MTVSLLLSGAILANVLFFQSAATPIDETAAQPASVQAIAQEETTPEQTPQIDPLELADDVAVELPVTGADEPEAEIVGEEPKLPPATFTATAPDLTEAREDMVFESESDEAVVDRVLAYFNDLKTLKATFVQTSPSGAFSRGDLYLRRPGQILLEYAAPSPLKIVATQGNVYVEDKGLETTDLYPIKTTPLKFLLTKNVSLEDAQVLGVERGPDSIAVTLASTDEETQGEISLILAAPTLQLQQWAVRDAQNGVTIVSLDNIEEGGRLSNRLFRAPEAGGAFINN